MIEYVTLTPAEIAEALEIAKARHENDVSKGIRNRKQSREGNIQIHARGLRGEFAFCKFAGLEPDRRTDDWDAWDFKIGTLRVDVKTPAFKTPRMYVAEWKEPKPIDAFAPVREIKESTYAVLGFQYADLVCLPQWLERNPDTGDGRYAYPFSYLEDVKELALLCYRAGLKSEIITRIMTNTIEEVR